MATDGKTNGRRSGGDKRLHRAGDGIEAMVEPATDLPHRHGAIHAARRAIDAGPHSPAEDAQRQGGSPTPVRRRAVVERLHRLAAGPEGAEVGVARALEILVATVAAGRRGGAGRLACTTAVAHCLEDMLLEPIGAGRMALCEGATWVLAWATRSQPAGGGERRLLERLESEAGEACERLRAGDPAAAASNK